VRVRGETVAIVLAVGVSISLLALTGTVMWAITRGETSDPARLIAVTQVLTGWGGGILGVLGAYVGYSFGRDSS
jgi:hypothetical protein